MIKIETFSPMLGQWTEAGAWRRGHWREALNAALANVGRIELIRLTDGAEQHTYTWGQAVAGQLQEGDVVSIRLTLWHGEPVDRTATFTVQNPQQAFASVKGRLTFLDGPRETCENQSLHLDLIGKGIVEILEVERLKGTLPLR